MSISTAQGSSAGLSPNKGKDGILSILIPSPSAALAAPAYFPSPKSKSQSNNSTNSGAVRATAVTASTLPVATVSSAAATAVSVLKKSHDDSVSTTNTKSGAGLPTPPSKLPPLQDPHAGSGVGTGTGPKHNPFGSVSPKMNPFMSMGAPKDHYWEGEEAEQRVAAASQGIAMGVGVGVGIVEEGGGKAAKTQAPAPVSAPAPAPAANANPFGASGSSNGTHAVSNPFLSSSSGLSLGFGSGVVGSGFASLGSGSGIGSGGGGLLSKLGGAPTAMFGSSSGSGGTTSAAASSSGGIFTSSISRSGSDSNSGAGVFGNGNALLAPSSTPASITTTTSSSISDTEGLPSSGSVGKSADGGSHVSTNQKSVGEAAAATARADDEEDPEEDRSPAVYGKTYSISSSGPILTGEEDEICLQQVRAKLYKLVVVKPKSKDKGEDGSDDEESSNSNTGKGKGADSGTGKPIETKEWAEVGLGPLRVLQAKDSNATTAPKNSKNDAMARDTRLVMRREDKKCGGGTKLLLNLLIRSHCTVTKNGDTTFVLSTILPSKGISSTDIDNDGSKGVEVGAGEDAANGDNAASLETHSYLLKCKLVAEAEMLMKAVNDAIEGQKQK